MYAPVRMSFGMPGYCAFFLAATPAYSPIVAQVATVRDSARTTIVESAPSASGARPLFRIADRPALQIGVAQGDRNHQFSEIVGASRLGDGSIVVADRGSAEIRIFDPTGRFVRKMGRTGQGPGEFRSLRNIRVLSGDSVIAWDASGNRLTVFTPGDDVARTFTTSGAGQPAPVGVIDGAMSDGSFFAFGLAREPAPPAEAVTRDTHVVSLHRRDGSFVRTVGRFPALERLLHMGGTMPGPTGVMTPAWSVRGVPFPRETLFQTSVDGLYAGDGTTYEIRRFNQAGSLEQIIRLRRAPQPVTPAIIARQRREPRRRDTPTRPNADPELDARHYPKTMPAYAAFRIDGAHRLWVQDYPIPEDANRQWNVFDRDGRLAGVVTTPPGVEVLVIGTSWLLGVWRDEFDVEYLRLYTLSPAS